MISTAVAVSSLRPGVEWTMYDNDVENIVWHTENVEPLTDAEVKAEMARLEQAAAEETARKEAARAALLERLGITEEEAVLLREAGI